MNCSLTIRSQMAMHGCKLAQKSRSRLTFKTMQRVDRETGNIFPSNILCVFLGDFREPSLG